MPGHHELRARQGHRVRAVGMMGTHQVEGALPAGPAKVAEVLRLPAELLKAGVVGKTCGRHCDLLSSPAVRYAKPKGGSVAVHAGVIPGGLSPVRGPEASRAPSAIVSPKATTEQAAVGWLGG